MTELFEQHWDEIAAWTALGNVLLTVLTVAWALTIKREHMSALAWCLVIVFLPFLGVLLFALLGWQQVQRPVSRKQKHKQDYRSRVSPAAAATADSAGSAAAEPSMARLALRFDASPVSQNRVTFFHEGDSALRDQLQVIRDARHHIHLEVFIFQPDETGALFLDEMTKKARQGVEVRLLYDAMGSHRLHRWRLRELRAAGGQCRAFLPLDPLRRRIQINMRNHRKIMVVDGQVAYCGGLNIGDEYLGKSSRFGFWRDTHLRLEGPAVADLQRVFVEDWDFAMGEHLQGEHYFPDQNRQAGDVSFPTPRGADAPRSPIECAVQVIQSGPDQHLKGIREVYFAAISQARRRLWIASPYFVPDAGLRDILCLAGWQGVDVRLLCQFHPDKWIPYYAGRYYWGDLLEAGVRIYQYTKGMMHSKVMLLDGHWASVGTANLDNRSLHLNFEVNCLLHTPAAVADLEAAFLQDLQDAIQLERTVYAERPFAGRLIENMCRLLSPIL